MDRLLVVIFAIAQLLGSGAGEQNTSCSIVRTQLQQQQKEQHKQRITVVVNDYALLETVAKVVIPSPSRGELAR